MKEKNLIFLISQPRSGSTLTQKIIGSHSKVYTRSEPWIMLNQLSQFKIDGSYEKYAKDLENIAVNDFIGELPNGKIDYIESLQSMYLSLYDKYLKKENKEYFLDKTPRYYLIIDELVEIFPNAKFIFLKRNPLAVLSSIINTWHQDDWYELSNHKIDLVDAIDLMSMASKYKDISHTFFYEDLLKDQTTTLTKIFNYIEIDFDENVLEYNKNISEKWCFGDPINVYEKSNIDKNNDLKWIKGLEDLQYWRIMYDYLNYIGKDKFEKYGYSFSENLNILKENLPCKTITELEKQTTSLFTFWDYKQNKEMLFNKRIQNLNKIIRIKDVNLKDKDKSIVEQKNIVKDKDKSIVEQKNIVKDKDKSIVEQKNIVKDKDKSIVEQKNIIKDKDKSIVEQKNIVKDKDKKLNLNIKELQEKNKKINSLISNKWYRFGQMSRKRKIWTIGKVMSKKLKLYWLLQPIAKKIKAL